MPDNFNGIPNAVYERLQRLAGKRRLRFME
jgi:hypothetical protein